jgi:ferric-dicitrate binding protein FerR (iron transport regulator)
MSRRNLPESEMLTSPLADAVDRLRAERPDAESMRRAADRVWQRLAEESAARYGATEADPAAAIAGCAGFQAQIPAYLDGTLAPERRLLLEDHSRECVPCRRALTDARRGAAPAQTTNRPGIRPAAPALPVRRPAAARFPHLWLAAAALLVAALGVASWAALAPRGPAAVVAAADGALLRVAGDGTLTPLASGEEIAEAEVVRTARDGGAVVRLADGSAVELAGGTELAVERGWSDTTLRLGRGHVIVEAAARSRGHLYVATGDCRVAVTGTIFAVNHGVKGSRVSVIEGEVRVDRGRGEDAILHPGQQVTTRASLTAVPVAQEVAWSRNHGRYVEMLAELAAIGRAIEEQVERPGLRYASALSEIAPASTAAYLAGPNLSGQVADGYAIFRDQLANSPVLAAWWAQNADAEADIDSVITAVRDFGGYLGGEVVVAFLPDLPGLDGGGPVVLAEVVQAGFPAHLDQEAARLEAEAGHPVLVPVADPYDAPATEALLVWTGDGLMIAAPTPALLAAAAAAADGSAPALPGTALHARLAEAYQGGVEWLFAGDFAAFSESEGGPEAGSADAERLGFADLELVVVEHRGAPGSGLGGPSQTSAELSFSGPRRGVVAWLAEPAPMGSLEYVSPDAAAAFAVVTEDPAAMLGEVLGWSIAKAGSIEDGDAEADLERLETELGFDPRDVAAALGGEVAFAIDGPLLPEPSWKLMVEVVDPALLQSSLEAVVVRIAAEAAEQGEPVPVTLEPGDPIAGLGSWRLAGSELPGAEAHYVYADGYLVAAPSRALLARTLDQRASGLSLPASARFRELVPADGHANFSGVFYQHLGPALAPVLGAAGEFGGAMAEGADPEQVRALAELAAESEPTLAVAYGEPRAIRFAAVSADGPFGLGYRALLGMGGLGALAEGAAGADAQ